MNKFFLNILLAFAWVLLTGELDYVNFIDGLLIGFIILFFSKYRLKSSKYFFKIPKALGFLFYFIYELIIANIRVAYEVITPNQRLQPGIIAVPLAAETDFEITILANLITLTPGTLSLEVSKNREFIYVHAMHIDNKEKSIYIILKTKDELLSETQIHTGPPVKMKENAEDFLKKWGDHPRVTKKPYENNGRLFVELRREYIDIKDFLKVQTKKLSLGKHIDKIVKKKYDLLNLDDLLSNNLKEYWTEYLDGKMTWER